ncbi:MAG: hypothetical protein WDN28_04135 [Chthoniobacter sp.]
MRAAELNDAAVNAVVKAKAGQKIGIRYTRAVDGKEVSGVLQLPPAISEWDFPGRDIYNGAGSEFPIRDGERKGFRIPRGR